MYSSGSRPPREVWSIDRADVAARLCRGSAMICPFAIEIGVLAIAGALGYATELKVDLNPPDRRGDALSPHWENWACKEGPVLSNKFGEITVTFRATNGAVFVPMLNKAALDYGAHMVTDGVATRGSGPPAFDIVIGGLRPGKHTVVTYHNEVRDVKPISLRISVGGKGTGRGSSPLEACDE